MIEGEEVFFLNRSVQIIKEFCSIFDVDETNMSGSDFKSDGFDGFIASLESFPFMSEKRLMVVREWYPTAQDMKNKALAAYLANPTETTILLVVNQKANEQLKKLDCVSVVDCSRASDDVIIKYIRSRTNKAKVIISSSVCQTLIDYCQGDLTRIDTELTKLIDYAASSSEITEQAVKALVAVDKDYQVYEMVNMIARKNYSEAYKIISETKTASEKQMLLSSLYGHFRRMFYCACSKEDNLSVANMLGVKEYAIKKTREQLSNFSVKKIKIVLDKLSQADADFKSGETTIDSVFDRCIFSILT